MKLFGSKDSPGELLDPHAVPNALVELVRSATDWLVLISPYFEPWRHLRDALEDAQRAGVTVRFLIRSDQVHKARGYFRSLKIEPLALTRLHAKIYVSDQRALLTSMNLYAGSRESLEFGLQIDHDKQAQLYERVATQAQQLLQKAEPVTMTPLAKSPKTPSAPSIPVHSSKPIEATRPRKIPTSSASSPRTSLTAKEKKPKTIPSNKSSSKSLTSTQQTSFDLWKEGIPIPDIAKNRGFKQNTILSHLAAAIELRWARLEDVVEEESRVAISEAVGQIGPDAAPTALVKTSRAAVSYGEVECVLAAMKTLRG